MHKGQPKGQTLKCKQSLLAVSPASALLRSVEAKEEEDLDVISKGCRLTERLAKAKASYTTRRMRLEAVVTLVNGTIAPRPGDLLLARVEKIGEHGRIELTNGRRAHLFVGDEVLLCYGHRYAPDQFEAVVPDALSRCHLVTAGGVAAQVLSRHDRAKKPTVLSPGGLLGDMYGRPLNLAAWALKPTDSRGPRPLTLAVAGCAMKAGKTTAAACLVRGLVDSGLRVGAAKVTGTGSGKDLWYMADAGAHPVLDFTDAGLASTYRVSPEQVVEVAGLLTDHLRVAGVDAIVLEIADGLFQEETSGLLSSPGFAATIDGIIFSAVDAMGASGGVEWLKRRGLPVLAVTGVLARSPLTIREAQEATTLPVLPPKTLCHPSVVSSIKDWLASRQVLVGALR